VLQVLIDWWLLVALLAPKQSFVDAFKRWYHVDRASYLPEPYMHVKMHISDIYVTYVNLPSRLSVVHLMFVLDERL
jgi:hypothetical protein